nr:hypothetical protein [Tanacetum cinerariifolium]
MAIDNRFVNLEQLRLLENSNLLKDQLLVYFDLKMQREVQVATEINNLTRQLLDIMDESRSFIGEPEQHLPTNVMAYKTRNELKGLEKDDMIRAMEMRMTTLADKAILLGADNLPPMLEKDMYDSWKSIMELYMLNRQHGRMILESVENGPLLWPIVEENRVTRPKKYSGLSATEAIQADCDVKVTNIILQGLPPEIYALVRLMHERTSDPLALVSNHQMTKSPYQTHQQSYHHNQFQPQVSSFKSYQYGSPYHSSKYDSQAQSSTHLLITYPSNDFQSSVHHNVYNPSSSIPEVEYAPSVHQQLDFPNPILGEGHMSKQCTKPKRKRDKAWFKDNVLLVQDQANGQVLYEEELEFLADPVIAEAQST